MDRLFFSAGEFHVTILFSHNSMRYNLVSFVCSRMELLLIYLSEHGERIYKYIFINKKKIL